MSRPGNETAAVVTTLLAIVGVAFLFGPGLALRPIAAEGFATYANVGGNNHEAVTRAALSCPEGQESDSSCFEQKSLTKLAGQHATWPGGREGGVGYPDQLSTDFFNSSAHCDDADWLAGRPYPRRPEEAAAALVKCIQWGRRQMQVSIEAAKDLVSDKNKINEKEIGAPDESCVNGSRITDNAKCQAIVAFGRALHVVEDFYSHSNWTDHADPPYTVTNPPGLALSAPARPLLLLTNPAAPIPDPPRDFTTGCYPSSLLVKDAVVGTGECAKRITHAGLTKDTTTAVRGCGPMTDHSVDVGCGLPTSSGTNFRAAVSGATVDAHQQWRDLAQELKAVYGDRRGSLMACAITHDEPVSTCIQPHLLVKAVLDRNTTCNGRCDDISADAVHHKRENYNFVVTADIPLTKLPKDSSADPAQGVGVLGTTTIAGSPQPRGTWSDDYSGVAGQCDMHETGKDSGSFQRIRPGQISVTSLSAVGPAGKSRTDFSLDLSLGDGGSPSADDIWVDTFMIIEPCHDTLTLTQGHGHIYGSILEAFNDTFGWDKPVTGWKVTTEPKDRVIASRHIKAVAGTVVLDLQIVTDDSCESPHTPPQPLVTCS